MELIAELMLGMLGIALEIVGEIIAQALFEVFADVAMRSLAEPFRREGSTGAALATIGYSIYGAAAGGLSLLLIPRLLVVPQWLRLVNLLITPTACGLVMAAVGGSRERRGKATMRLDTFTYGFVFALAMALVRFFGRR